MGVSSTVRRELGEADTAYQVTGSGGKLICSKSGVSWEFWPASGKWLSGQSCKGYGLRRLIHYLAGTHGSNGRSK